MHAQRRRQFGKNVEVAILRPDREVMRKRSRSNDGVHRSCPPAPVSRGREQIGKLSGDSLVIRKRDERTGPHQRRLSKCPQRPIDCAASTDEQLGQRRNRDTRITIGGIA